MKLYYSDTFELPLPDAHRFPMAKYRLLRERLAAGPHKNAFRFLIPAAATDDELSMAHTTDYIDQIKSGDLTPLQIRRIGFPWSDKMVERSRRSTGASIEAGRAALEDGVAANLAGGTHHSFADRGQGFCVFNDVCVAARVLQYEKRIQRALVIDCDVHQGNGTASICLEDPSIFTFSMHCGKNFPFKKTDGDFDLTLPEKTKDRHYLAELESALDKIMVAFQPDLVFYLAGADPFEGDRLGLLSLSKPGLKKRDQLVFDFFRDVGTPVSVAMAGGYAPNLTDIVDIHEATILAAAKCFGFVHEDISA